MSRKIFLFARWKQVTAARAILWGASFVQKTQRRPSMGDLQIDEGLLMIDCLTARTTQYAIRSTPHTGCGGLHRLRADPNMRNKANFRPQAGVSSLKFQVSRGTDTASGFPTSHFKLETSRSDCVKQSQFPPFLARKRAADGKTKPIVRSVLVRAYMHMENALRCHYERGQLCETNPIAGGPNGYQHIIWKAVMNEFAQTLVVQNKANWLGGCGLSSGSGSLDADDGRHWDEEGSRAGQVCETKPILGKMSCLGAGMSIASAANWMLRQKPERNNRNLENKRCRSGVYTDNSLKTNLKGIYHEF